jgi:hypothetical protein
VEVMSLTVFGHFLPLLISSLAANLISIFSVVLAFRTVPYGSVVKQESLHFTETQASSRISNSANGNTIS